MYCNSAELRGIEISEGTNMIFETQPGLKRFSIEKAANILQVAFSREKVAKRPALPQDFKESSLTLFEKENKDISNRLDGFGTWINGGGETRNAKFESQEIMIALHSVLADIMVYLVPEDWK